MTFAGTAAMRLAVVVPFVCVVACREQEIPIRAEQVVAEAGVGEVVVVDDAAEEEVVPFDGGPIPARTARRARFATEVLTYAAHGIDGTFELWRDRRLDDARVAKDWFTVAFAFPETSAPPGFEKEPAASAQLILRDSKRRILESLDLEQPLATMTAVRLGDEVTPYLEVAIDTFTGGGNWNGTTHRFVRVERARSRWLTCAEAYKCGTACNFHYDERPSGGFDLLVWRHWYDADLSSSLTYFTRREIVGGACADTVRTEPGWVGSYGSKTAIRIPASFPPSHALPSLPP